MPRKEFEAFTRLDASDVNTFLMDQSVMSFADSTARTTAIPTPVQGMLTYLEDSNTYESYNGSAYVTVADGSGWTTFVPSFTALTIGNGTFNYAKFKVIGKTAHVQVKFALGSTSAVTGDIRMEVPTEIRRISTSSPAQISAIFRDVSNQNIHLTSAIASTVDRRLFIFRATNSSGTYLTSQNTSSTIPFTWTISDEIQFSATYEVE
jgi:hypothetical protein